MEIIFSLMATAAAGLIGLGIAAGVIALIMFAVKKQRERLSVLQQVVEGRGGRYEADGMFSAPSGTFPLMKDLPATVSFIADGGDSPTNWTDLTLTLPYRLPPMHLRPQHMLSGIGKALGMQDIEVGSRAFDDAFLIKGTPRDTKYLLSEDIQDTILQLRAMHASRHLDIHLTPDGDGTAVCIRQLDWIDDHQQLDQHISACAVLLDKLIAHHAWPWQTTAEALGLTLHEDSGEYRLTGTLHGIPVQASLRWRRGQPASTVQALVSGPDGLRVVHRDHGRGPSLSVDNPVLGMMVHVSAKDEDGARSLLADPALTESLLEIVHGISGAMVTDEGVVIQGQGWSPDSLAQTIDRAARLAAQISARQISVGEQQAVRRPTPQPQRS